MKQMERRDPLTALFPADIGTQAQKASRMALEARRSWALDNPEKVRQLNAK